MAASAVKHAPVLPPVSAGPTTTEPPTPAAERWLHHHLDPLRRAVHAHAEPADRADAVAAVLQGSLPSLAILTPGQLRGSPAGHQQYVLHVDDLETFSVTALVRRPGQFTPVHDHVCWCVSGVLAGIGHEVTYRLRTSLGRRTLVETGRTDRLPGDVSAFAPPGDVHRVVNTGSDLAVSLQVYGADIAALGTSVRRRYPDPRPS